MMTPLEIKEKRFQVGWMGFKKKEVIDFLDLLSTEVQVVLREKREMSQQLEEEKQKQKELLEREALIRNVLVTAQDTAEKVRENAAREAELIIKEAELHGEKISQEAERDRNQIIHEIEELKTLYKQFKAKVTSTLDMYGKLLEDEESE